MDPAILVPLGCFAVSVLVVALYATARIYDIERESRRRLHIEEMEHQRKMKELEIRLQRIKTGR
jgi:hypothetical protein